MASGDEVVVVTGSYLQDYKTDNPNPRENDFTSTVANTMQLSGSIGVVTFECNYYPVLSTPPQNSAPTSQHPLLGNEFKSGKTYTIKFVEE
jgi:hypothetical protein